MAGQSVTVSSGPTFGIASLTTLVFVVLKLTNVIAWSWWWVLSPLWISFGLWLIFAAIVFGVIFFVAVFITPKSSSLYRSRKRF